MNEFNFGIPQDIKFGVGIINNLSDIVVEQKITKPFIVSDKGLEKAGLVKRITDILDCKNIKYELFLDVIPNPTNVVVDEATKKFKESKADGIIALGGGSSMDTSKAISIIATYGGEIMDYEGPNHVPGETTPIIAIPTTAGTGSEVTRAAVFTNVSNNWKFVVQSNRLLPRVSILDPEMITGLPFGVAASTGIDALIHAVEAYLSKKSNPYSDAMAEKAMELIGGNIRRFVADRTKIEAAGNMLLGSMFAGLAFSNTSLGIIHAMSHPLSGHLGVAHGVANAILFPAALEFNAIGADTKYERIYNYIKNNKSNITKSFKNDMLYEEVKKMLVDFNIPLNLTEVGVTEEVLDALTNDAMKSGNIKFNPRFPKFEDVKKLYISLM